MSKLHDVHKLSDPEVAAEIARLERRQQQRAQRRLLRQLGPDGRTMLLEALYWLTHDPEEGDNGLRSQTGRTITRLPEDAV